MQDAATTALAGGDSEFWNQFVGSSSANMLTIIAVGLFWGLKKLCNRKSKCKTHVHCPCIDVDVRDPTMHEAPDMTDEHATTRV